GRHCGQPFRIWPVRLLRGRPALPGGVLRGDDGGLGHGSHATRCRRVPVPAAEHPRPAVRRASPASGRPPAGPATGNERTGPASARPVVASPATRRAESGTVGPLGSFCWEGGGDPAAGPREIMPLGSTGSIGTQAAEIVRRNAGRFRLAGLASGGGSPELLAS